MVATPYTADKLLEAAELAGYAVVLSRSAGRARLRFTRLLKGRPRGTGLLAKLGLNRSATVAFRIRREPVMLGDWWNEDCFVPGHRVLTYLRWSASSGCYVDVWWNATTVIRT
jgi:hypothetical protein